MSEADAPDEPLALSHDERLALIGLLQRAIHEARFPYSPRLDPLKAIVASSYRRQIASLFRR